MTSSSISQSSVQALIPFTGFYMLDPAIGSFVMVDTSQTTQAGTATWAATITLCQDGTTSQQYTLGDNCTFNDNTLVITSSLLGGTSATLTFSNPAGVSSVSGTISNGTLQAPNVSGTSPFAPIPLSLWAGTYYAQGTKDNGVYPYTAVLQVKADGTVYYAADGQTLTPVQYFRYDYAMFVIALVLDTGVPMFEMGTASGWGRVAGNAEHGQLLVSIQQQIPVTNLC